MCKSEEEKRREIEESIKRSLSLIFNIIRAFKDLERFNASRFFKLFLTEGLSPLGIRVKGINMGVERIISEYKREELREEVNYKPTIGELIRPRTRFQINVLLEDDTGDINLIMLCYIDENMELVLEDFRVSEYPIKFVDKLKEELEEIIPKKEDFYKFIFFYILGELLRIRREILLGE